jgi:hypothetical protein
MSQMIWLQLKGTLVRQSNELRIYSIVLVQGMAERLTQKRAPELLQLTADTQSQARARPAVPEDAQLVTPLEDEPSAYYPNCVCPMTNVDSKLVEICFSAAATCEKSSMHSQKIIRKMMDVQVDNRVTYSNAPYPTAESLLGGVPIIDHLGARAREESGLRELIPAIREIRNCRIPCLYIKVLHQQGDYFREHTRRPYLRSDS